MTARPISLIQDALDSGVAPAIQVHAIFGKKNLFAYAGGDGPGDKGIDANTRFDIASLTKIMATSMGIYRLASEKQLDFDDPLSRFHSNLNTSLRDVSLRALLGHRSGLGAWEPLFMKVLEHPMAKGIYAPSTEDPIQHQEAFTLSQNLMRGFLYQSPLVHPPGTRVYSDIGFMLLGLTIEAVVQSDLDTYTERDIFSPLGLNATSYHRLPDTPPPPDVVPTGTTRPRPPAPGQEKDYTLPATVDRTPAHGVDDDNAFALGGVAGHAGLFSTARDVARFGALLLEELHGANRLGKAAVLDEMIKPDSEGGAPHRGLGFDHPSGEHSSVGKKMRKGNPGPIFGHLGFTGTSLWIDPHRNLSIAILTNRTFPDRNNLSGIRAFRPKLHDALLEMLP